MNKKKKRSKLKKIFFIVILIMTYIFTLQMLNKINLDVKDKRLYKFLINNSTTLSSNNSYDTLKKIINFKPNSLISNNLVYDKKTSTKPNDEVISQNDNKDESNQAQTKPVVKEEDKRPTVYIYNTHQSENYNGEYLADYSITPNVLMASYMLKEDLEEYGIYSYVEEDSVSTVLNKNKWKYYKSYTVTKSFMEKRKKEMPTLKYYIDLHRDSVKRKYTTTEINDVSYAKIMLLVGLDHKNYQVNLQEAKKINNKLNKEYPGLSRGIYKKSGKGVNGIYNQDFSKYTFLFEVGGTDNNIQEVNNSISVLAKILNEYIKEEEGA